MTRKWLFGVLLLWVGFPLGCSYFNLFNSKGSTDFALRLQSVDFEGFHEDNPTGKLVFSLTNNNPNDYPGYSLAFTLNVEGHQLAEFHKVSVDSIAGHSKIDIVVPFELEAEKIRINLPEILSDGQVNYQFTGTISFLGFVTPVHFENKLLFLKIKFLGMQIRGQNEMQLNFQLTNPNEFSSFPFGYLGLQAFYKDTLLFSAQGQERMILKPGSTAVYKLNTHFDRAQWRKFILEWFHLQSNYPQVLNIRLVAYYGSGQSQILNPDVLLTDDVKENISQLLLELY